MGDQLPLPTLLSQVLAAFTIEFDNEAECQMTHRTTRHGAKGGSRQGPWLVSMVMWSNCMRFLGDEPLSVAELERRARTKTNLAGMQRWGYITIAPDPNDAEKKPSASALLVRPTPSGRNAQEVWGPLFQVIEQRWDERFGPNGMKQLRTSLGEIEKHLDPGLPDCLPILGYGLFSRDPRLKLIPGVSKGKRVDLPLSALLARVLLALALEFESESKLSLAIYANVLRVLDEKGVRMRDLPRITGVSKEAINMAMGILRKAGLAVIEKEDSASRSNVVCATARGLRAKEVYRKRLIAIEERWTARFGNVAIRALRDSLERLVGSSVTESSPLFLGLEPYPDGWRARVPKPKTLPHFPMVLHRGGYPDGS